MLICCPGFSCKDHIPATSDTPAELAAAIKSYMAVRQHKGRGTAFRISSEVCVLIKDNKKRLEALQVALARGWPVTSVDFKGIPRHIIAIFDLLEQLIDNPIFWEATSCVWGGFEGDLESDGLTIKRFAVMKPSKISPRSQTARGAQAG